MLLASPGGVSPMAGPGSRLTRSSVCVFVSVCVNEREPVMCSRMPKSECVCMCEAANTVT